MKISYEKLYFCIFIAVFIYLCIFRQKMVRNSFCFPLRVISYVLCFAFRMMFLLKSLWNKWLASCPPNLPVVKNSSWNYISQHPCCCQWGQMIALTPGSKCFLSPSVSYKKLKYKGL